ncbi:tripartite tricarboxylate transporter substrate binding protein [Bordetella sp. 15P40C-2]|uniref:Bug family tripartite tricarboxylate transporter substrate binding protein n=1 Tax=Bordetella sp. 15P40C-2 TaxID=2572246 RepID=UPI00132281E1|nr:tripartite tricarboxylate transporter substrate binding protein [Bordetella sp. 15P40C-2]MVW71697.1 tripartite tricarboxylate transporter substrate binding protein [Bordetella sp. 15P40C-2]
MNRRHVLRVLATTAGLFALPTWAKEESYPNRPVTLVIPYPPGGPTDAMGRVLASTLSDILGQIVIVENRAGANGNIGAEAVARANPDGYTLMLGTSGPLAINASLYKNLGYDPVKSYDPIIQVGYLPNILVVHPSVPATNVKELVALSKAKPGTLSYASSGSGASSHLAGVLFNSVAGTDFLHIPYKGTGPALNDLLGGQVSMSFTDVLTAIPHIQSGRLRALGVTTASRSRALPDLPTIAEQGYEGYDVSVFFGIVAPAHTPPDRVARLNEALQRTLQNEKVREFLDKQGLESAPDLAPEALGAFVFQERDKWAKVVADSGAGID